MVELAKVFLKHGAAVAVALIEPGAKSADFSAAVARARASNPSVSFHVLPPPAPAPTDTDPQAAAAASANPVTKMFQFLAAMNAPLRDFLCSLPSVDALVSTCSAATYAQDVASQLELPVYNFYASGAAMLAIFLNLPSMVAGSGTKIKDLGDSLIAFPGAPPFKASELPSEVINSGDGLPAVLGMFERIPYADGIPINSLETRAVRSEGRALRPWPHHAAGLLRRAVGLGRRRRQQGARVPPVARRAAGQERGVPLLRQHGHALR
jgi:hypothetical protein